MAKGKNRKTSNNKPGSNNVPSKPGTKARDEPNSEAENVRKRPLADDSDGESSDYEDSQESSTDGDSVIYDEDSEVAASDADLSDVELGDNLLQAKDGLKAFNLSDSDHDDDADSEKDTKESEDEDSNFEETTQPGEDADPSGPGGERVTHDIGGHGLSTNVAQVDEYLEDSSDEEDLRNTIGNVPIEWYKDYAHIGYNLEGKKIIKPQTADQVDEFLRRMEDPLYWRTVRDKMTGQNVVLVDKDVDSIKRVSQNKIPDPNYDPYPEHIDFFTHEKMIHPVTNRPETKASFIPSLSEKRLVSKLVSRMKAWANRGRSHPKKPSEKDRFSFDRDIWTDEDPNAKNKRMMRHIPAPKEKLPQHFHSYNPPPEYLLTEEEEEKLRERDPEDNRPPFFPRAYPSLREVPAYPHFIQERFERCLDLYLCPRQRKMRARVNPDDLIPQLPKASDLKPFPNIQALVYFGHVGTVNCIDIEPVRGQFLVSGGKDKTVRLWEVLTGRCLKIIKFEYEVNCVAWCPDSARSALIAVSVGKSVYLLNSGLGEKFLVAELDSLFSTLSEESASGTSSSTSATPASTQWKFISQGEDNHENGVRCSVQHPQEIRHLAWHRKGDYFSVVYRGQPGGVVIHQLSRHASRRPFANSKGAIVNVLFHPTKPYLFVATQRAVRVYNLLKQELTKKLVPSCKELSTMAIHPGGDNLIIGSLDLRLSWFDMDLSTKPYKTLRYHKKAIRRVRYHSRYPLFASVSDDGTAVVTHATVYDDLSTNALIVPVKVLRGNKQECTDCVFHPNQPWLFTAGCDGSIRLYSH